MRRDGSVDNLLFAIELHRTDPPSTRPQSPPPPLCALPCNSQDSDCTMMARHSGLQKEVLALYRKILRVATEKDHAKLTSATAAASSSLSASSSTHHHQQQQLFASVRRDAQSATYYARQEFRRQSQQVKRNDFKRIEYMIRKGEKHLKLLKMPGVQTIGGGS